MSLLQIPSCLRRLDLCCIPALQQKDRHAICAVIHTESHETGPISILCAPFEQEDSTVQEKQPKKGDQFFL